MRRAAGVLFFAASVAVASACAPAAAGVTEGTAAPIDSIASDGGDTGDSGAEALALPGLLDTSDEQIPNDDEVRTGTLANGLRYFVRENDRPGGRVDLRLAIRAGSVNETGANSGVAHFVEHMLFNGTEQYPENELIDVLRSFGATFGADINAYTSYDETVYSLEVPNDDESFATGLTVLEQWLSHATFDPAQVEHERGVILDEWRQSTQTTDGRLFDVAQDLYLAGSAYAGRDPIGTDTSIEGVPQSELRQFYDDWYRPDNAAVVVVGDIDASDVVDAIEELFEPATPRSAAMPERPATTFAIETSPDFALHADPDQTSVDVEVDLPIPSITGSGTAQLRARVLDQIVYRALVHRLDQDVSAGIAPFDGITTGSNSIVGSLDAPALYAFTDAARVDATLQALLDEYERANRFGFTDAEVVLAKSSVRAGFDAQYDGRDTKSDPEFADEYVDHFLTGSPYPEIEALYDVSTAMVDAIAPEAIDARFRARWANSAPHVIISAPVTAAQAGLLPTEDEVLALIGGLSSRRLEPRSVGRELPDELMVRPQPEEPVSVGPLLDDADEYFDPVEIVFPNGARVLAVSNDIVDGRIVFQAASPGGTSLVADDDVVDALFGAGIVLSSGAGEFNPSELQELLADRDVELNAWMTPYNENFFGNVGTSDLEVLLQMMHLYMTQPRFDPVTLGNFQRFEQPIIADPGSEPDTAGYDALVDARYQDELRYTSLPSVDEFATLDLDGIERVWRDRYGDAGDWVFVFAGDFDMDELTELAESYIGTLPGDGAVETWIDVEPPAPLGVVERTVQAGTGDTASLTLLFTSPVTSVDGVLRASADVVTEVLNTRLTDVVREQLGESYSPSAYTYVRNDPEPVVETYVYVTGAPDRIEAVGDLVVRELADLATSGPSDREFDGAFAQVREDYNFIDNETFVQELVDDAIWPSRSIDEYFDEYVGLDGFTAGDARAFIARHVRADQHIAVTVVPR
jgi:zinc protease